MGDERQGANGSVDIVVVASRRVVLVPGMGIPSFVNAFRGLNVRGLVGFLRDRNIYLDTGPIMFAYAMPCDVGLKLSAVLNVLRR